METAAMCKPWKNNNFCRQSETARRCFPTVRTTLGKLRWGVPTASQHPASEFPTVPTASAARYTSFEESQTRADGRGNCRASAWKTPTGKVLAAQARPGVYPQFPPPLKNLRPPHLPDDPGISDRAPVVGSPVQTPEPAGCGRSQFEPHRNRRSGSAPGSPALTAQDTAQLAQQLWKQHNFEGAVSILSAALSQLVLSNPDRQRLLALQRRCAVWAAWDRFDYAQALRLARQDPQLRSAHARTLAILQKTVSLIEGGTAWPGRNFTGLELVIDLQQNAERCAGRARYDDAVCRLYRATELLAQIRLMSRYAIRTHHVDPNHKAIPESARQWLEGQRTRLEDGKTRPVQIGLAAAYQLLGEMEDPLGVYYREKKSWLLNALSRRNSSLFAHGLTPIGPDTWRSVGKRWQQWLKEALQSIQKNGS